MSNRVKTQKKMRKQTQSLLCCAGAAQQRPQIRIFEYSDMEQGP